jgi:hypothetical protein
MDYPANEWREEFDNRFVLDSNRDAKSHKKLGSTGFSIGQVPAKEIKVFIQNLLTTHSARLVERERERIFAELKRMSSVYETVDTGSALKALQQEI